MVNFYGMFPLKNTLECRMALWESQTGRKQGQKGWVTSLAWRGPQLTIQAALQKKEKLITMATHCVADTGSGNSNTMSASQHNALPRNQHLAGWQKSLPS